MTRIEILREKVKELYEAKHSGRVSWCDWIYENHVFIVAENARILSERFELGNDLAEAAAMLHDIADAVMDRKDQDHEQKSLEISRKLLTESGYSNEEIAVVVDDAIANHSCRDGNLPQTMVGKILATADVEAHLCTDFYKDIQNMNKPAQSEEAFRKWVGEKLNRDFTVKIFFPEVQAELKEVFEKRKAEFGVE